jgi:hypothetical protein
MCVPLIFRNHFQHGYVVRNLEKAMAPFRERCGIGKWQVMPLPAGSPVRAIALAYVQNVMIELIEAVADHETIYRRFIPESESAARFHHLGYLLEREEDYLATVAQFDAAGWPSAYAGRSGEILDFQYADTVAQLGHYCELVHLRAQGKGFFSQVPHN